MSRHVEYYVRSCHACRRIHRRATIQEGSLQLRAIPEEPNTVVSLHHFGPLEECDGYRDVLVCVDHATRYVEAGAVTSTLKTFYLDFLMDRWTPRFGVPKTIVTDQAKGFVNKRTAPVHRRLGIAHVTTPPYWRQANGLVERMVGILKNVLRKLSSLTRIGMRDLQKQNRDRARQNLEKSLANAKRLYDGKHKAPNFRIGDTVYCTMGHR
ncbi:uncharacterized protein LOC121838315 [Ixodes scapularis]|uniref:uncharacterized protein LOC121838315 n=1 Tax=Ixodes scapularis TaxID=6945 RepID=UPI001C38453C|nr:uncharacterized protein LOC121838315 [Ixodes scapularis]